MSAGRRGMDDKGDWLCDQVRNLTSAPAVLRDRHLQVVASNPLARALSLGFREGVNIARYTFVEASNYENLACWGEAATEVAAMLRESLDHHQQDGSFRNIVGDLSAQSHRFATAWAGESAPSRSGSATFQTTPVGSLRLSYTEQWADDDHHLALLLFSGADDQASEDLKELAEFIADDPFSA